MQETSPKAPAAPPNLVGFMQDNSEAVLPSLLLPLKSKVQTTIIKLQVCSLIAVPKLV